MSKKINTKDLIEKIEKLTKARIAGEEVVSLDKFREAKTKLEPKSLLIIEDDESMRAVYQRVFSAEGYDLRIAEDAQSLSKVLDDKLVDLIILDIGLPWINGFEVAQMLRDHKDLKKIPIIFVSGHQTQDDMKKAFQVGADDFIKKPFDVEKLKKSVASLIKLKSE